MIIIFDYLKYYKTKKNQKVLLVGSILDALYFPLNKKEVKVESKSKTCFTILKCGYLVLPLLSGSFLLIYVNHGPYLVTRVSVQSRRLRIQFPLCLFDNYLTFLYFLLDTVGIIAFRIS